MDSRCSRPGPGLGGFRSGLSPTTVLILLALTISACGGGGGGSGFQEGKGFPGDTDYADSVIRPYYVNNGLVNPTVPPGTVLPATVSNQSLLTANVPNQGEPGTCATVSFAQLVYGADVAGLSSRRFYIEPRGAISVNRCLIGALIRVAELRSTDLASSNQPCSAEGRRAKADP